MVILASDSSLTRYMNIVFHNRAPDLRCTYQKCVLGRVHMVSRFCIFHMLLGVLENFNYIFATFQLFMVRIKDIFKDGIFVFSIFLLCCSGQGDLYNNGNFNFKFELFVLPQPI